MVIKSIGSSFLLAVLASFSTAATDIEWGSFGTLSITISDSDTYGYRRDITSDNGVYSGDVNLSELSLIGGQVDAKFSDSIDFVGQMVFRDLPEASLDDYITLGFFRYKPSSNWEFRVGRLAPSIFAITEYRHINVAYTWAKVPNEIYGIVPNTHYDGLDVTYTQRFNDATATFKLFGGTSTSSLFSYTGREEVDLDNILGGTITYDANDWNLHARYTHTELVSESAASSELSTSISQIPDFLWPNKQNIYDKILIKGEHVRYMSFSGQRYIDNWLLSFELANIDSGITTLPEINGGYVSAAYNAGQHTYYGLHAFTSSDNFNFDEPGVNPSLFPDLVNGVEAALNFFASNQSTWSLGWRWDINSFITTKLQLNITEIESRGATLWQNTSISSSDETVNSVMFTLSYAL